MHELSDKDRKKILGEAFYDEFKVMNEYLLQIIGEFPEIKRQVAKIPGIEKAVADIPFMKADIAILKRDMQEVKETLEIHGHDINYLKTKVA